MLSPLLCGASAVNNIMVSFVDMHALYSLYSRTCYLRGICFLGDVISIVGRGAYPSSMCMTDFIVRATMFTAPDIVSISSER